MENAITQIRIALAQMNPTVGDLEGNTRQIIQLLREADARGCHLIAFPELAITGYPPEDLLLKPRFLRENLQCLDRIVAAQGEGACAAVVGFVDVGEDISNAAALVAGGKVAGIHHKIFLPTYSVFDEDRYFGAGRGTLVFNFGGVGIGVGVCEDIWYGNGPARAQALEGGAEVLVSINASPFHREKWRSREHILATRAMDNTAFVAYVNAVGAQDELLFDGHSMVFGPGGDLVARGPSFEEALVVVDLDISDVFHRRLANPSRRKERALGHSADFQVTSVSLPPFAGAVVSEAGVAPPLPPPEGGEPGGNTSEAALIATHASNLEGDKGDASTSGESITGDAAPYKESSMVAVAPTPTPDRVGQGGGNPVNAEALPPEPGQDAPAVRPPDAQGATPAVLPSMPDTSIPVLVQPNVPPLTMLADTYKGLVLGVRDYVRKNGFKNVVLGLSGGIDSALVACIAVDALGNENVTGITMPSRYSSEGTKSDAAVLAGNLDIRFLTIPIEDVFEASLGALAETMAGTESGLAEENLQARIRGNYLMTLSNKFGWLVLTTGNKSEMAVGYSTLYGDMAGGFAVIKDVPKTLVFQLAAYRNTLGTAIPETTITRPPSAELREDQKDTDSLPPYEVLDGILNLYVEEDRSLEEIVRAGYDEPTVRRVILMVDRNEYKRRQSPPGLKITPKAFGRDRRLPITNRYHDW